MFRYFSLFILILLTNSISVLIAENTSAQQNPPHISLSSYNPKLCPGSSTTVYITISGQLPIQVTYEVLENGTPTKYTLVSSITPLALELSNAGVYQITNYGNKNIQVDTSIDFTVENVLFPTAQLSGGGEFCENEQVTPIEVVLTGASPWELTYQENNGNAIKLDLTESHYFFPEKESIINIRSIKDKYCSKDVFDTASIKIDEIPLVEPIKGKQKLCPGWNAIYETNFSDRYVYDWYVPTGGDINTLVENAANQFPVTWLEAGKYYIDLIVSSPNTGCNTGKISYPVEVFSPPTVKKEFDTVTCFETDNYVELSPTEMPENKIFWPHLDDSVNSVRVYEEGWYYYIESIPLGCADTGSIRVVDKCIPEVYVPEAFTPNNDQINDRLEIFGVFYNLELRIYNLNGELIHIMKNTEAAWDGTKNGQEMPIGTYLWKATFTDKFEEGYSSEGQFILIR